MNEREFLDFFAESMDCDLNMDTKLDSLDEWDSMGQVVFMADIEDKLDLTVEPAAIGEAVFVIDLFKLVQGQ